MSSKWRFQVAFTDAHNGTDDSNNCIVGDDYFAAVPPQSTYENALINVSLVLLFTSSWSALWFVFHSWKSDSRLYQKQRRRVGDFMRVTAFADTTFESAFVYEAFVGSLCNVISLYIIVVVIWGEGM